MANVAVYNMEGKEVGSLELNDAVFGVEVNEHLVHMAVLQQLANNRQGTQKAKTRSEVRGGGRKPWRQKGTGHARQGSTRAPQWTQMRGKVTKKYRDQLDGKHQWLIVAARQGFLFLWLYACELHPDEQCREHLCQIATSSILHAIADDSVQPVPCVLGLSTLSASNPLVPISVYR